ncbi:MAG TPA: baseplate J/gp47 family protein [Nitriliruptorales bacterium]|nr:baseplate J/gp47 family protein [Nitriliruptorales bacterium]
MNDATLTLIHRPYGGLVDDLLTAIVGGVVNEPIRFDVKSLAYPLAEPSSRVRGITGTHGGAPHSFIAEIDYIFSPATNTVIWLEEGTQPDDATTFYVDYFRIDSRSPLTDINVGSVTRTLSEAIGREIASVYGTINLAYLAGFVDTAEGRSLDHVVSILGAVRKTAEFAEGLVTFFRTAGVEGNITIPAGLGLTTTTGDASFVTTQQRTLQRGQVRIDVPVRAAEGFAGEAGQVDAGAITEMTQPVAGIDRITNLDPTIRAAADETDNELRDRARAALRALGQATLAALDRVIREGRGEPVEFFDPNSPLARRTAPGHVAIVVDAEPERLASIQTTVHQTRAAGVVATLIARYVFISPHAVVTIAPGISAAGKEQIVAEVIAALQAYVDGLTAGDPAAGTAMLEAIRGVEDVVDARIVDVVVTRADLSTTAQQDIIDVLLAVVTGADPTDEQAIRQALEDAVTGEIAFGPTGARMPDRSLLLSTSEDTRGGPASDEDIEAATFEVSATVAGDDWWIALEMDRADILLEEQRAED